MRKLVLLLVAAALVSPAFAQGTAPATEPAGQTEQKPPMKKKVMKKKHMAKEKKTEEKPAAPAAP